MDVNSYSIWPIVKTTYIEKQCLSPLNEKEKKKKKSWRARAVGVNPFLFPSFVLDGTQT